MQDIDDNSCKPRPGQNVASEIIMPASERIPASKYTQKMMMMMMMVVAVTTMMKDNVVVTNETYSLTLMS